MKASYILPLIACAAPATARTVTQEQLWLDISATGSLSGRLLGMVQAQPRFRDAQPHVVQLLARGGLGWRVDEALTVWVAYTHIALPVEGAADVSEERIYEQASYVLGSGFGGVWSGRTRMEERWRSNAGGTGWRLRQQFRYVHPLAARPAAPSLVLSLEPMIDLNDTAWGARSGFDQLRSFAGLGFALGHATTLETGYLNQVVNQRHGVTGVNHAAVVSLAYRF